MGLPNINITFKTQASTAVSRSQKGTVAVVVRDSKAGGAHTLNSAAQVPSTLGKANQDYIKRAFLGYVNPPRKVIAYVLPSDAADLAAALTYLGTQRFDYLAGPPDITEAECTAVVEWVKARRQDDHADYKAVLPHTAADSEAVVNVTTDGIQVGNETYTAGQYCSRIAGLIAGTPMNLSCTYAALPEVADVERKTRAEMDAAIDGGQFILFHDGEKVKVGRGVNGLTTVTADKGAAYKKIKLVETLDMIAGDIRATAQDTYIGRFANSYDNKCLLITAIQDYLAGLERSGMLRAGASQVGIDLEAQARYLEAAGVDTSSMSEQEIKEANTGDTVFLAASIQLLDAIEALDLTITI